MNDATDALLLSILKRAALAWVEAARFTWQALRLMWRVNCSMRVEAMADALDGVIAWLNESGKRNEKQDIEVVNAIKALSQAMNKQ
jgi:hypothetical protein